MPNQGVIVIILLIAIVVIALVANERKLKAQRAKAESMGAFERVYLHTYLGGLPNAPSGGASVTCWINEDSFLFMTDAGTVLDSIPRDAVRRVTVDDKTKIFERLSATRLLLFGPLALAAPKKVKSEEYCLVIEWESPAGATGQAVFQFEGSIGKTWAFEAASTLPKYAKAAPARPVGMADDEQKCPHCAEIIKREAKLCRFCRSRL